MFDGVALLGIVTAATACWMIDKVRDVAESAQSANRANSVAPTAQIADLRQTILELRIDGLQTMAGTNPATDQAD